MTNEEILQTFSDINHAYNNSTKYDTLKRMLDELTEQSERKVGKWHITDAYPHNVYCSVCHKKFAQTHWAVWEDGSLPRNFCPNCGADMRGEQDE